MTNSENFHLKFTASHCSLIWVRLTLEVRVYLLMIHFPDIAMVTSII